MSKKQKSQRNAQPPVKPTVAPPTAVHAAQSIEPPPTIIPASVPLSPVIPIAEPIESKSAERVAPPSERNPFEVWARLPFVMMEAWLAPFQRGR